MREMTKIRFAILNDKRLKEFSDISLSSAMPLKENGSSTEGRCECKNGDFLRVIYVAGMASMARAETEYEITGSPMNVLKPVMGVDNREDMSKCTFKDIKLFMNWKISKDNYL